MVAVASAQHYQNDYHQYQHQEPQYHQYAAPAVIKTVQPALIKSYQPAVVKQVVPIVKKIVEHHHEEPANYDFEYAVHDEHTGDIKEQHESAKDGAISGFYSLIDADGYKRVVHYTADDHHGFQAKVEREPVQGYKVAQQPQIIKKIIAQPAIAVQKYVAPAPQYQYQQAAPQYHYQQAAPQYQHSEPKYYSAPAPIKVVAPVVVQKVIAQPAIAIQKYVAPVQKYVAPVQYHQAPAQVAKIAHHEDAYTHVSFNGPASNYHY